MSVDYTSCSVCEESWYEECVNYCEKCGENICLNCITNKPDGYSQLEFRYRMVSFNKTDFQGGNGALLSRHCPFCQNQLVDEDGFIRWLIGKLGGECERNQLEKEYLAVKKGDV